MRSERLLVCYLESARFARAEKVAVVERMIMQRESVLLKSNSLRCPACFLVRDLTPKNFTCTLTRCPRVFLSVNPPGVPTPAVTRIVPQNPK